MAHIEFSTPSDDEFLLELGLTIALEADGSRTIEVLNEAGQDVTVSFDPVTRAVSVVLAIGGREIVRVVREGASKLRPRFVESQSCVDIEFQTADLSGSMRVTLAPQFALDDSLLFH